MARPRLPAGERIRNATLLAASHFLLLFFVSGRSWWGTAMAIVMGTTYFAMHFIGPNAREPIPRREPRRPWFPIWVDRKRHEHR